jgi:colicin import membrane protein
LSSSTPTHLTPATVFAPGGVEGIISKLETDVRAIDRDISTEEGREAVKSLAYKVARSKTALDDMGKELVAGIKAQAATIDAERRIIRDRLDALKNEVRDPLTAWEDAEEKRVGDNEAAIVAIIETARQSAGKAPGLIRELIHIVAGYADRDWQEFKERADVAITDAIEKLNAMLATAEQAERDAAELAELRQLKAERDEADRKAAEAAHAAEQARQTEEARAARAAQEAAQAAEIERQRAERAEQEKIAAAARAVEQERERVARAKADEERTAAKREANKKHRAQIHADIVEDLMNHDETCGEIVEAIARGAIRHLSITY